MPDKPTYTVTATGDVRADGTTYGPFTKREAAEACVIALAGRADIKSATIVEGE